MLFHPVTNFTIIPLDQKRNNCLQYRNKQDRTLMDIDVIETDNNYQLHVDLPGVSPDQLDLSIEEKIVTIKAERNRIHDTEKDKVHALERSFGKWERKFKLPPLADLDHASSQYKNGVLSITFPKLASLPGAHKIAINTE